MNTNQTSRPRGRLVATLSAGGIVVVLLIGLLYYATNPFGESLVARQQPANSVSAHADLMTADTIATTTGESAQTSMSRVSTGVSIAEGVMVLPPLPVVQEIRDGASAAAVNASLPVQVIRNGATVAASNASLPVQVIRNGATVAASNASLPGSTSAMVDVLPGDGTGGVRLVNGFSQPASERAPTDPQG